MINHSNDKNNHHVVPIHYLKAFSIPECPTNIWKYTKNKPFSLDKKHNNLNPQKCPLKKACSEYQFNSYEKTDGTIDSNTYEDALQKWENLYIPSLFALQKVTSHDEYKKFLDHYKMDFINCLNIMILRGYRRRDIVQRAIKEHPEKASRSKGQIDSLILQTMFSVDRRIVDRLHNYTWNYLYAPKGKTFITSDNPVIPSINDDEQNSFIIFPISPQSALVILKSHVADDLFIEATISSWEDINKKTAKNCIKHYYHHTCAQWIASLA
jgi:hypothetical protein